MKKNNQNLLQILVAIAWIDGEIQAEEKKYLTNIALDKNICSPTELERMLEQNQNSSTKKCHQLLAEYLGDKPNPED